MQINEVSRTNQAVINSWIQDYAVTVNKNDITGIELALTETPPERSAKGGIFSVILKDVNAIRFDKPIRTNVTRQDLDAMVLLYRQGLNFVFSKQDTDKWATVKAP